MSFKYTATDGSIVTYERGDCGDPMCSGDCMVNVKIKKPNHNSTVDDRERRKALRCPLCKPNRNENRKKRGKRGAKKPKGKK